MLPDAVGGRRARQAEPARALGRRETQANSHSRETALRWGRGSVGGRGTQGSTEDSGSRRGRRAPPSPLPARRGPPEPALPGVARGGAGRGRRQGCGSLCVTQHRLTQGEGGGVGPPRGAGGGVRGLGDSILRVSSSGRPRSSKPGSAFPPTEKPPGRGGGRAFPRLAERDCGRRRERDPRWGEGWT